MNKDQGEQKIDAQSAKKALCIASLASNLDNFNRGNVEVLLELGYDVTLASNFNSSEDTNSAEKIDAFAREMEASGVHIRQIDFSRSLGKVRQQMQSVRQVKELLAEGFDLVHCHSPICAAITRACARKYRKTGRTKVVYTAHGFHFFDGAPRKNWLIYYPVEKAMSRYTDTLITINSEDYERAKEKLHAVNTVYLHGVGIDLKRWNNEGNCTDPESLREEIGLAPEDVMLLSVGELNENKNHRIVLDAMAQVEDTRLHYVIAGIGPQESALKEQAAELGLQDHLHLLSFRTDVQDLCQAADLFILPSLREGLCMALMEAVACHTPVICGRIRGNVDLIKNPERLFDPHKAEELALCIRKVIEDRSRLEIKALLKDEVEQNYMGLKEYDKPMVQEEMREIYQRIT